MMVLTDKKARNRLNALPIDRSIDRSNVREEPRRSDADRESSPQNHLRSYHHAWGRHDILEDDMSKNDLISEIALKAESLRRRKRNRAMILSVMKGGSAFVLVLAIGLAQTNFPLYLFFALVACIVLGVSTFLERGE